MRGGFQLQVAHWTASRTYVHGSEAKPFNKTLLNVGNERERAKKKHIHETLSFPVTECCRWIIIELCVSSLERSFFPLHNPPTPAAINALMHIAQEPMRNLVHARLRIRASGHWRSIRDVRLNLLAHATFFKERQSPNPKVNDIERHLARGPGGPKIPRDLRVITKRAAECMNDVWG